MFKNCISLKSLDLNADEVISMFSMFLGCSSLEEINFSNAETINVNNMGSMFEGCSSLKKLNISKFKTSEVKTIYKMFF